MREYLIGVDGGNTKADYFLFHMDGRFVDGLRDSTCSHEIVGYDAAETIINARIRVLLQRNGLKMDDIIAGGFGLAGIDHAHQRDKFTEIIGRMGIPHFVVSNDSFLGIIAGTSHGAGICSINGTGTVAGGIDPAGNMLQVGGIGFLVGDDAGGSHIAYRGVRAVYDSFYRLGEPTLMAEPVFAMLGISKREQLMCAIGSDISNELGSTEMTRVVFAAAELEDACALQILDEVGLQLAKTAGGCAANLDFGQDVEVVLAGSVWVKAESQALFRAFERHMATLLPQKRFDYRVLEVPPATGAVMWAMQKAGANPYLPDIKARIVEAVERNHRY